MQLLCQKHKCLPTLPPRSVYLNNRIFAKQRSRVACRAQQNDDDKPDEPPGIHPEIQAQPGRNLQLPQSVISRLRESVFSLDTLFVRSVENYGQNGILFKGKLRGDPAAAHAKMAARLKESELGEGYVLFLMEDQEEQPVAVILPTDAAQVAASPAVEAALAALLGAVTILTTLNIFGAELFNAALLIAKWDPELVSSALPGTLATLGILATHELGHIVAAKRLGLELAPPILVPAGLGLLGSFGGITRIRSVVPNRTTLAAVTAPGPLTGSAVSLFVMLVGVVLTAGGVGGLEVDAASFKESILVGALSQAVLGQAVFTSDALNCNPLFVAGWAGLIVNSINCLPAGELDGGRVFLALFGRRAASRVSAVTFLLLGLWGITNSLALFWFLLVLTLQRGPVVPCEEELSPLQGAGVKAAAWVALLLPLLMLLPYPSFELDTSGALAAF